MQRSKRIQPIEQHLTNTAENAARQTALVQKTLKQHKDQLEQLEIYRAEYQQSYMRNTTSGIGSTQLRDFQAFLAKLDKAIEEQKRRIVGVEQQYEQSRQHWLKKRTHAKAVSNLVERYQDQEMKVANKREQMATDEFALRFAGRFTHK